MRVKTVVEEDFTNYRLPSMFIGTISCDGKCCTEAGIPLSVCQNDGWRGCKVIDMKDEDLVSRYINNPYTEAVILGGLEPFEQFDEVCDFIKTLREHTQDDVVIYTGYYPDEINGMLKRLKDFSNIIVKFGRFVPGANSRYDDVLGITLVSDNQYAERIS